MLINSPFYAASHNQRTAKIKIRLLRDQLEHRMSNYFNTHNKHTSYSLKQVITRSLLKFLQYPPNCSCHDTISPVLIQEQCSSGLIVYLSSVANSCLTSQRILPIQFCPFQLCLSCTSGEFRDIPTPQTQSRGLHSTRVSPLVSASIS